MATHVGDIFFDAKLEKKDFERGLSSLEKSASSVGSKLGKALTVTAVIGGITSAINKVSLLGDTIDKTSQKLGMSRKAYQEWDYILQRNGASIDSMTTGMRTLASSVETGKDALRELGISEQEALGLSQEQLFERVITALQGVEDGTRRTYLASQLLGRSSTELGAVLNLSAQDMAYLRNNLASLGGIMSDQAVANSAQFRDALLDVRMALQSVANVLATYVLPVLTFALNNVIIPVIKAIAQALQWLFSMLGKVGKAFGIKSNPIKDTFNKSTQKGIEATGNAIGNVGGGLGKTGKNAKGAKKAVQELKRELMGFDQITKLSGKSDSSTGTSGGGGLGSGGGAGIGDLGDLGELDDIIDALEIPDTVTTSWDGWKELLADVLDLIVDIGKLALEDILSPLIGLVTKTIVPNALDIIGTALKNIVDFATRIPTWLMDLLTGHDKEVKITVDDQFTKKWQEIKDLDNSELNVKVKMNGELEDLNGGQVNVYVALQRGFVGTVADWLKNNNYIGTVSATVGLVRSFGSGISTVAEWIVKSSLLGASVNMAVGLVSSFGNGISTVAQWITQTKLGGGVVNFGIKLATSFGNGVSTVAEWIKGKANWGDSVYKPISLKRWTSWSSVAEWISNKTNWGGSVYKPVSLSKTKAWKTVGGWITGKGNWGDSVSKSVGLSKTWKTVKSWIESKTNFGTGSVSKEIKLTQVSKGKSAWKTVTEWVKNHLGSGGVSVDVKLNSKKKASGGIYQNGWKPITKYASGGSPTGGQMFIAREAGPELVGTLKGHTAVMNNDQIVASVASGVAKAITNIRFEATPALASTRTASAQAQTQQVNTQQMVTLLQQLLVAVNALDLEVNLDGETIKNNTVRRINNHTRATGQLELIV